MKVKVCGIAHRETLEQVTQLGPDYVGLIFYPPSPRYVVGKIEPEWVHALPPHVKPVGVFVDEPAESILRLAAQYRLKAIQLHGHETPQTCRLLRRMGYEIFKAFGIETEADLNHTEAYSDSADYFLFDSKTQIRGGSGVPFAWELLAHRTWTNPWWISGGIGLHNLNRALDSGCTGVDLNSRFETAPGIKNTTDLKEAFARIASYTSTSSRP